VSDDNSSRIVRFGVFEVDLRAGELRRRGLKVKLQEQPLQVLTALLEHPGEVVTRRGVAGQTLASGHLRRLRSWSQCRDQEVARCIGRIGGDAHAR
jgi:DNA-binding response OmpR family regulator